MRPTATTTTTSSHVLALAVCLLLLAASGSSGHGLNHHVTVRQPLKGGYTAVNAVPLHRVRLAASNTSYQYLQQQQNLAYLNSLDVDRLLYSFRVTANLGTKGAQPYQGWEAPDCELRGHFVGHYLSATAFMAASTGDPGIRQKMASLVDGLQQCQDAIGTGYLSAFPTEEFDRLEAHVYVWAPYYTVHKIMAGLFDQYTLSNSTQAWGMVQRMADYFYDRVQAVLAKQGMAGWQAILNEEWGGMNEVLYNMYALSGDPKHLELANLFDHYDWSAPLANGVDDLGGNHANTHIPEVIGAQRGYELTQNRTQLRIAEVFFKAVTTAHSYPTYGSSNHEYWGPAMSIGVDLQGTAQQESCTQYNILKVARHFFQQTANPEYLDFYEHAVTNGIIGNQRMGHPGQFIYMLPQGDGGVYKGGWGDPVASFWCCYGTLIESMAKFGDSIYFTSSGGGTLYVAQYVSSTAYYAERGVTLEQQSQLFEDPRSTLTIRAINASSADPTADFTLSLRVPKWAVPGQTVILVNGQAAPTDGPIVPGQFASIARTWKVGDVVAVRFGIAVTTVGVQDSDPRFAGTYAVLYGPVMLVAVSTGPAVLGGNRSSIAQWLTRDPKPTLPGVTMTFTARSPNSTGALTFIPFYQAMEQPYSAYVNLPFDRSPIAYNATGTVVHVWSEWDTTNPKGGASCLSNPDPAIRSGGNTPSVTSIDLGRQVVDATHTVTGIAFEYSYNTGYKNGHTGTNFTLWLVPQPEERPMRQPLPTKAMLLRQRQQQPIAVYRSPKLTEYPYDDCPSCYSPPQRVASGPLDLQPKQPFVVRFQFENYDRNLQLLLNLNLTVYWK